MCVLAGEVALRVGGDQVLQAADDMIGRDSGQCLYHPQPAWVATPDDIVNDTRVRRKRPARGQGRFQNIAGVAGQVDRVVSTALGYGGQKMDAGGLEGVEKATLGCYQPAHVGAAERRQGDQFPVETQAFGKLSRAPQVVGHVPGVIDERECTKGTTGSQETGRHDP